MTIADNLNRIINAKSSIKASIENKGVYVGDVTIDEYASKIDEISGGDAKIKLPDGICLSGSTWTEFDMSQYDWSSVYDYGSMFKECHNLTNLTTVPIKPVDMSSIFQLSDKLVSLDTTNWDTSDVTDMSSMFYGCVNLTSLDTSNWDTSKVTSMKDMFRSSNLSSVDTSNWDTSNVINMSSMFYSCDNLTSLDTSNWNTSKVTSMKDMFYDCKKLTYLDLNNWDTSNVTDMSYMFNINNSTSGNELVLDGLEYLNVSNVTNMSYMFKDIRISEIDLSNWDTSKVTNMSYMFNGCFTTKIIMGGDVSKLSSYSIMFGNLGNGQAGEFYYNEKYDYSKIIAQLPSSWTAIPTTFNNGL